MNEVSRPRLEQPRTSRTEHGVRIAASSDVSPLAGVLARAFAADPFVRWLLGNGAEDSSRVARLYAAVLSQNLRYGQVLMHEGQDAVAVFRPPRHAQMSLLEELSMMGTVVRSTGPVRFARLFPHLLAFQKHHPTGPVAQLVVLGVDPTSQGRGLASLLVRPVLREWDRAGLAGYLETSKASNLPLYERFGFEVTSTLSIPNGPDVWFMTRQPSGCR